MFYKRIVPERSQNSMENTDGYIRTSRKRIEGTAGSDPEAQAHQLAIYHQEG